MLSNNQKMSVLAFIGKAKANTYASTTIMPIKRGNTTQYQYKNPKFNNFLYTDCYIGVENFCGSEVVTLDGVPVFCDSYAGIEFIPFDKVPEAGLVLKEALSKGPVEDPFYIRGCNGIIRGHIQYSVKYIHTGDYISGTEFIYNANDFQTYCDKYVKNSYEKDPVDIINELLITGTVPDWLIFRCDFQGGFVSGV